MSRVLGNVARLLACASIVSILAPAASAASTNLARPLALPFTANDGDQPATVAFSARSKLGTTFVTRESALVHLLTTPVAEGAPAGWSLVERFVGGSTRRIRGDVPVALPVVRLQPDGRLADVRAFSRVSIQRLYPSIDLALVHGDGGIERIYRVAPGGDPRRIRVALDGASGTRVAPDGRLLIDTPQGVLSQSPPVAWQEGPRGRVDVPVRYRVRERDYGFEVASYDRSRPLYIDPILATTYLGGSADDVATDVAIHPASGDVYATGLTNSGDFPGLGGGTAPAANRQVYVVRLDRALGTLKEAALLATSGPGASRIAIHPVTGDVYVMGLAKGGIPGLPSYCVGDFFFVLRLAADLRRLLGGSCPSTLVGTNNYVSGIAVGPNGDVYASGGSISFGGGDSGPGSPNVLVFVYPFLAHYGFDLTPKTSDGAGGGPIAIHPVSGDVYVLDLSTPLFTTRLLRRFSPAMTWNASATVPTSRNIDGGIAVHPSTGDVYLSGTVFDDATARNYAFVSRFDSGLRSPMQSIRYGGSKNQGATALAIDPASGDVFIGGSTLSADLPGTSSGAQPLAGGAGDAFIARFSPSLAMLRRATYFGGTADDDISAIALDPASGDLVAAGMTYSPDLPARGGAQPSLRGARDAFIARISKSLSGGVSISAIGGGGQRARSGESFGAPLSVRLKDVDDVPVAGIAVTFTLPATGPRATFVGGASTAVAISAADGTATSPALTAALDPGAFVASASAMGATTAFDLAVDPINVVAVPINHPLALLLCIVGIVALAKRRARS